MRPNKEPGQIAVTKVNDYCTKAIGKEKITLLPTSASVA